ncbi:transcription termination factor 4, mitochondrial [Solea senegalensis]|uniref:Transcription termination factor 4, mitochondrial n=2 Tax=Solea senegalensis TaxID=28829 RepID=A0AAV6T4N8_SOLSE|nr:transcription termination factor 4, mitochondrial [Solea senegalensis]KAG7524386.1 transcription termination factor 4, mitochondrial [Solea senegalensis]
MATKGASRQVLRVIVRNIAASSLLSPLQVGRCFLLSQPRLLCSSSNQTSLQSAGHISKVSHGSNKPVTELSLRTLVDMGFTEPQAEQLHEAVSTVRGASATKHALSTLTALFVLGYNTSSVQKLLLKCPELCTVKEPQLQQRISNLRKLGFVEGSLQRVVAHYPQILTVPVKKVNYVVLFLRERCLFTTMQITDILRDNPAIILEDLGQVEYKFQYVFFRMGIKQREMIKSRLFRFSLDEVRSRHCFLERRGLYQTPDKKGQTTTVNPKLDSILNVNQDTFLTAVAMASAEEYEIFQRLMAREWQEQEKEYDSIEADSDEEEDDEDDEETGGKHGYRKWRKK